MNLPVVVEIAIGLIFIYLIFSLLASEIQELLTTLLQWRAVHLKESIEGLLAGSNETPELRHARLLANRLYKNPVVNTLNQEAKGLAASLPRRFNQTVGRFFRRLFKMDNVFGDKNSGPSYISSRSFAISFLETLGIPAVIQKFTLLRMLDFKTQLVERVQELIQSQSSLPGINEQTLSFNLITPEEERQVHNFLQNELQLTENDIESSFWVLKKTSNLRKKIDDAIEGYKSGGFDLATSINRFEEILNRYIEDLETYFHTDTLPNVQPIDSMNDPLSDYMPPMRDYGAQNNWISELQSLRNDTFGKPRDNTFGEINSFNSEKTLLLRSLQPNLTEAVEIIKGFWQLRICWSIYKEVRKGAALEAIAKISETINSSQANLPEKVRQSLLSKLESIKNRSSNYGYERIKARIQDYPKLNSSIKQNLIKQIDEIIDKSYQEINDFIEIQYEPELPQEIKNALLQKVQQGASRSSQLSSLSYEFEKIRRTEFNKIRKNLENPTDTCVELPTNTIDTLDDIIEKADATIKDSYAQIQEIINQNSKLPTPAKQSFLDLIDDITGSSLDVEYESFRRAVEEQPGLSWSLKQSFMQEIDTIINDSLKSQYERFKKTVEQQPNLDIPVKQSLLLLATAVTLRKDNELAKLVDRLLGMGSLPPSVERNLLLLAQQAQIKVGGIKEELNQLRREVEAWFDRSMERSSGVYKRNAKLISILIGSLVAVTINADTIHMVTRLSKDQILRSTVIRTADYIAAQNSDVTARCLSYNSAQLREADPECARVIENLDKATENIALPIGWGASNRLQQWDESTSLGGLRFFRYLIGWIVSGIAFSMGASFWYDLLNKFINVRNAGKPQRSATDPMSVDPTRPSDD
jgi:hypothetical protein